MKLYVQDVTLRDGMHAMGHMYTVDQVRRIVAALDRSGVAAIEVAHGDGLGGSSANYGFGAHSDEEWIEAAADVLEHAKLTTLLLPGIGTIDHLRRAHALGVRSVRVAGDALHRGRRERAAHLLGPGERDGCVRVPDDEPSQLPRGPGPSGRADGVVRRALRLCHRLRRPSDGA
ncbi:isopropylmalate/homocitrate/citramalate synthase [Streptomyces sp. TE4109]